jgi:hypothetical protein
MDMRLLGLLFGLSVLELVLFYVPGLWRRSGPHGTGRRVWAGAVLVVSSFVLGLVVVRSMWVLGALLAIVHVYRVVNLLRVVENRTQATYLRRVARRTSWWLNGLMWLWLLVAQSGLPGRFSWHALAWVQLATAGFLLVSTLINIRRSAYRAPQAHFAQRDLPTVTVAIPARNETTDLVECLESVVASTYPKLEVIVLDDCSQTNTSDIIKQFAQNGVRFIAGDPPREAWLAKNQAYDALADAATGEYILFCGADVRFAPDTITNLVEYALATRRTMVSVLPQRLHPRHLQLILPMRYWWELAPPRFWMRQPPSLSTCWLIERGTLNKLGRFDAVSHRVRPETYFARETYKQGGYSFLRSGPALGVASNKHTYDQFQTAIRVRYAEGHKRPELVCIATLAQIALFVMPMVQLVLAALMGDYYLALIAAVTLAWLVNIQVIINKRTGMEQPLLPYLTFPFVIATELYLINESMRRYEFAQVTWRGRNICLPVMHASR